jgi:transposase
MARRKEMTVRCEDTTETSTNHMALDLGRRNWTVGFVLPGDREARLYQIAGGDREARLELIGRHRSKLGEGAVRIVSCYEAGRDGFWLDRWLKEHGVDNRIVDPASLEVLRRRRRVKTDKVDTVGLLRVLLRLERGEAELTRVVRGRLRRWRTPAGGRASASVWCASAPRIATAFGDCWRPRG